MEILEKEKQACLNVLKEYNIKYNTDEIKKLYKLYDYLLLQMDTEPPHVKLQIQEDIEIIMTYLHNSI